MTNVAHRITGIYAAITWISAANAWIHAAIVSGKVRKFLATRMKFQNIISIFVLNATHSVREH